MTLIARVVEIRDRLYRSWSRNKDRIAGNWQNAAYMAEIDRIQAEINRADRIKRNRSEGARKGWATRRARSGVADVANSDAAGGSSTARSSAIPALEGDELYRQRIACGWAYGEYEDDAMQAGA